MNTAPVHPQEGIKGVHDVQQSTFTVPDVDNSPGDVAAATAKQVSGEQILSESPTILYICIYKYSD